MALVTVHDTDEVRRCLHAMANAASVITVNLGLLLGRDLQLPPDTREILLDATTASDRLFVLVQEMQKLMVG